MTHPDGSRSAEHGRVLAGVKAMPFGWPTASLDPDSGRDPPARSGSPAAEFGGGLKRQKWVFTVSGDCHTEQRIPEDAAIAIPGAPLRECGTQSETAPPDKFGLASANLKDPGERNRPQRGT
jgi:hypothetical protein